MCNIFLIILLEMKSIKLENELEEFYNFYIFDLRKVSLKYHFSCKYIKIAQFFVLFRSRRIRQSDLFFDLKDTVLSYLSNLKLRMFKSFSFLLISLKVASHRITGREDYLNKK